MTHQFSSAIQGSQFHVEVMCSSRILTQICWSCQHTFHNPSIILKIMTPKPQDIQVTHPSHTGKYPICYESISKNPALAQVCYQTQLFDVRTFISKTIKYPP